MGPVTTHAIARRRKNRAPTNRKTIRPHVMARANRPAPPVWASWSKVNVPAMVRRRYSDRRSPACYLRNLASHCFRERDSAPPAGLWNRTAGTFALLLRITYETAFGLSLSSVGICFRPSLHERASNLGSNLFAHSHRIVACEPEVETGVDASVGHLSDRLRETCEASGDARQTGRRHGESSILTEERRQHGRCSAAYAGVRRGIFLEVRRRQKWLPCRIGTRVGVAVRSGLSDRGHRAP